jgi:N-methylhydantoinase A/oxoprolinase/acetone carboxylase beta subunit
MTQDEINAVKKAAEKMRKQESNQDEIIRFAIQCRLVTTGNRDGLYMDALTEFAKLVAAKAFQNGYEKGVAGFNEAVSLEREACKALAKEYAAEYKEGGRLYPMLNGSITKTAATACDHIVYIIGERGRT